jgi:hypothetical protein
MTEPNTRLADRYALRAGLILPSYLRRAHIVFGAGCLLAALLTPAAMLPFAFLLAMLAFVLLQIGNLTVQHRQPWKGLSGMGRVPGPIWLSSGGLLVLIVRHGVVQYNILEWLG